MALSLPRNGLLVACLSAALQAATFAPIPPDVWALKEDPAQGVKGAVVLESRMVFNGNTIVHVYRVRVLSEEGREAASFREFLPEARDFEGRTVQRDGSVVTFDKVKDFSTKTQRFGWDTEKRKVLVPPGVTADCVVELRWVEYALAIDNQQIPVSLGPSAEWVLGGPFRTRELVVEFTRDWLWSALVLPGSGQRPQFTEKGGGRKYVFRDLPGREPAPYALRSLAGLPTLVVWQQPQNLIGTDRQDIGTYWKEAARIFLEPHYHGRLSTGRAFRAMAEELLKDLPPQPQQAASLLLRRLDRRIRNVSFPTLEETSRLDLKAIRQDTLDESRDLDRIVKRGAATYYEMRSLFLALLEKAGIHPILGLLKSRSENLFLFDAPNVYQADHTLVGIPMKGAETLWLDPALRYAPPGLIRPYFQGWEGLAVDTATWSPQKAMIPVQPAGFNVSRFAFNLAFQDGTERYALKTEFSGWREYLERWRFMALAPEEQNRILKEEMEKQVADSTVTKAEVRHAVDPDHNVAWEVEGVLDRPLASRIHFDPFPGMGTPLPLPASWPEKRVDPIVVEHLGVQVGTSEFLVPKGYVLARTAPFSRQNSFGKVAWLAESSPKGEDTLVKVVLRIDTLRAFAPASAYEEFKAFLGWVNEAYHAEVVLEKP